DINNIAEGATATAAEIQANPAVADLQVPDLEVIQPIGQGWVQNVELALGSARTDAENRRQHEEKCARGPSLGGARDGIVDGNIRFAALHATKQLGKAVVTKSAGSLVER